MNFKDSIVKPFTIKKVVKNKALKYVFLFPLDPFGRKDLSIFGLKFDNIFYFLNFKFMVKGRLLFAFPSFGPSQTVFLMECLIKSGMKNFIIVGSCASLGDGKAGDVVIPDEAFSFASITDRYLKDEQLFPSSKKLNTFLRAKLNEIKISKTLNGRLGSVDAVFRETKTFVSEISKKGCDFLDMESASAFCLGKFHNVEVSSLLVVLDVISVERWNRKVGFLKYSLKMKKLFKIFERIS